MDKRRLRTRAAVGTALALLTGMPLKAQESAEDYRTIVTIMRACAMIAEVPARVACYDNTVASAGEARTSAAPLTTPLATRPAGGFGAETLPQARDAHRARQVDAVELAVTAIRELQPGIAVLTLADGGHWRFVDAASFGYDMPRRGQAVRLERGALGSFYLHFNGQRALRIQRVQ